MDVVPKGQDMAYNIQPQVVSSILDVLPQDKNIAQTGQDIANVNQ